MIAKWKVFNFKSISEETELDLGPLTIFAGSEQQWQEHVYSVSPTCCTNIGTQSRFTLCRFEWCSHQFGPV